MIDFKNSKKELDKVALDDTTDVLSQITIRHTETTKQNREKAIDLFEMGVLIAKGKIDVPIKTLGETLGLHRRALQMAKKMAIHFDMDKDKFIKAYDESGIHTWSGFCNSIFKRQKSPHYPKSPNKAMEKVLGVTRNALKDPVEHQVLKDITKFRERLARLLPLRTIPADKIFMMYQDCAVCGDSAEATDGHTLIKAGEGVSVPVPVCDKCIDTYRKSDIDWQRVAKYYYIYAMNLESDIDVLA